MKHKILLSRTDSIGDVLLTLPLAGILKKNLDCEIFFLAKNYTAPVIQNCAYVDHLIIWDDLEKQSLSQRIASLKKLGITIAIHVFPVRKIAALCFLSKIALRIGTTNRWYHWLFCNERLYLTRKNSNSHEAQLNTYLLAYFDLNKDWSLDRLNALSGLTIKEDKKAFAHLLDQKKYNIIIHPLSNKSAQEYPLESYAKLIESLDRNKYQILITGLKNDQQYLTRLLRFDHVVDCTGKFDLLELMQLIKASDALIACSTGPLHIASMLGIFTVGIYPPRKPMNQQRWGAIGSNTKLITYQGDCPQTCKKNQPCFCMQNIKPSSINTLINQRFT